MKVFFFLIVFIILENDSFAQNIGIGTTVPNSSALLELKASDKGLLMPRTSSTSRLAIVNPGKGLLLYDTTTSSFWFFDPGFTGGWGQIASGNLNTRWSLSGNSGTDPLQNFLGTTDSQPLIFKTNNIRSGMLTNDGNIFWGLRSGNNNIGYSNIGIGTDALKNNTNRSNLLAIGDSSLFNNGSGATILEHGMDNLGLGSKCLFSNTIGFENLAIGTTALFSNTIGNANIAIGANSLVQNIDGSDNIAIGVGSLLSLAEFVKNNNTAVGSHSFGNMTSGSNNTGLGYYAGNTTNAEAGQENCTFIGSNTGSFSGTQNMSSVGFGAIATGNNRVRIGNTSVESIGGQPSWTSFSDGRFKRNIAEDVKGLDFIMKLRPVTYNLDIHSLNKELNGSDTIEWSSKYEIEKTRFTGFIAQEVEIAANLVGYDFSGIDKPKSSKGQYGLRYSDFVMPLVKGMQEQEIIIEEQNKRLDILQIQINTLLKEIQLLKDKLK